MYLTFVKGIIDGTEGREILKFTDLLSAKATMHSRLGSAMGDTNCSYAFASITDSTGKQLYKDSFVRPVEVVTETTEETADETAAE